WSILVGDRAARAANGFAFGAPQHIEAKGKTAPVIARELLGRAAPERRRVPIVGRDADLAQLDLVARRAFADQRPYLVSIIAPAGTGKTRLLEEFLDRLPTLAAEATIAISQCLPYGQRLTYWPLRGVLYRLASIDEDATPPDVRSAL